MSVCVVAFTNGIYGQFGLVHATAMNVYVEKTVVEKNRRRL